MAGDHHGVALKSRLTGWLTARGHLVDDLGTHTADLADYPPLCAAVGRRVAAGEADLGVVIGGSGQGEVIACNKVRGVRAGLAYSRFAVEISRGNNDANVMVLGTKVLGDDEAEDLLALWLATPFKGGVHAARVAQIGALEDAGRLGSAGQ
ncbi:RpiB/LacA/LacB family sugar-phosphate isomerase [Nonomuraea sp. NN258]|nr:RpiB/LacA/LacB family sugar-phosphate isomerase [Nonomuraea antri]